MPGDIGIQTAELAWKKQGHAFEDHRLDVVEPVVDREVRQVVGGGGLPELREQRRDDFAVVGLAVIAPHRDAVLEEHRVADAAQAGQGIVDVLLQPQELR
ncbi:hypothetical protein [Dyella sedimenti]|uniref:hypothetical protein n=1 Tax=Dyella sedimenti TaxID=2919947 RepID=UPI001FAAE7CD|nr:hypothetical protein [Dyella sedimenti]